MRPQTVDPSSRSLALILNLAKTPPKTNLNLPQEKPGTAPPRLRLRLSTSLRHPKPRPLCDRLLTTNRPATLAPRPHQRQRSCPPLYTNTQHKTIPILAGVGGGDSNFSVTKNSAIPTSNARPKTAPTATLATFTFFSFTFLKRSKARMGTFLCFAVPNHSPCPIGTKCR